MDCTWEVTAPPGHLILLAFHSMVLEEHKGCQYDFVTVFDGKREEGVELGRVQSQARDPPVTVSYVECSGDESSLDECEVKWGRKCSTTERAAVHCQGVTVVGHDSESRTRVSPFEEAGCYSRQITYRQASLLQLRSLIQASESCTQLVKLECRHTRFLGEEWGWWVSWDGRRMNSWGSTSTDSKKCACGERGDCDLGLLTCNCDANDEVWRSDEGYLSDKASLPMRDVRLGDTRDMPMEMAFHTIGKLRCTGQSKVIKQM
ncbi:NRX4 protein, partial [Atractosteus spatula]|nr:NRX4 protein [Atractosteus spatula]